MKRREILDFRTEHELKSIRNSQITIKEHSVSDHANLAENTIGVDTKNGFVFLKLNGQLIKLPIVK